MISVITETNELLIINKPEGMLMHHGDKDEGEETILSFLLNTYPWARKIDNPYPLQKETVNLSGIVHRLDRDTSGIIVIAKNQDTLNHLKKEFSSHEVRKKYVAVVNGYIICDISIDIPLGREKKGFLRAKEGEGSRGPYMDAHTHARPLSHSKETNTTLVELTPTTGRTHQLRAHLSLIGKPIVGDVLYGNKETDLKEKRLYLHAESIEIDGITYVSPVPESFREKLQDPSAVESPQGEHRM